MEGAGNIILTKTGVKLLDFGLAKLQADALQPAFASPGAQPTRSEPLTRRGTILGTLHYMAPEQLEGASTDARSDIFSFGAVLYEMLTGRRAFEGESPASIITAVMSSQPRAVSAPAQRISPALDWIVNRCLAKDRDQR